jgi:hypothetical protein
MTSPSRAGHFRFRRLLELSVLAIALLAAFVVGARLGPDKDLFTVSLTSGGGSESADLPAPATTAARSEIQHRDEPRVREAREKVIRETAAALVDECRRAADGDWERWKRQTAVYRKTLRGRIAETGGRSLHGLNRSLLFEVNPGANLDYLNEPELLNSFRRDRAVVAADRWLSARDVDLIFVAVPKLTEIYIEQFLDPCPPDGIIAPHVRQTLWELLDNGVELVDAFPLFRTLRDSDKECLYQVGDTHWGPRGMRVMAKYVADRIERYPFAASARYRRPIFKTFPAPANARERIPELQVPDDDPGSPILLIGNSYARGFREHLVKELNLPINSRIHDGGTTEFFADFLREPELLSRCRVVVWVSTEQHMTHFLPLPAPVAAALAPAE